MKEILIFLLIISCLSFCNKKRTIKKSIRGQSSSSLEVHDAGQTNTQNTNTQNTNTQNTNTQNTNTQSRATAALSVISGPSIVTYYPSHQSTEVSLSEKIIFIFDKNIKKSSGKIRFRAEDEKNSIELSILDEKIKILREKALLIEGLSLLESIQYTVEIDEKAITDDKGNYFKGLKDQSYFFTTADINAPRLRSLYISSTLSSNPKPQFTFYSSEKGSVTYEGPCLGDKTRVVSGLNLIILSSSSNEALGDDTYSNCKILVRDPSGKLARLQIPSFTVDTTGPSLSLVDSTYTYGGKRYRKNRIFTLDSSESGKITYQGSCGQGNEKSFSEGQTRSSFYFSLQEGSEYTDCQITVTDRAGNSTSLVIPSFYYDSTPPSLDSANLVFNDTGGSGIKDYKVNNKIYPTYQEVLNQIESFNGQTLTVSDLAGNQARFRIHWQDPVDLVGVSFKHACIRRKAEKTMQCWVQSGARLDVQNNASIPPALGAVQSFSVGDAHTCAIRESNSQLFCWGDNGSGLAAGAEGPITIPPRLNDWPYYGKVNQVFAGASRTCVTKQFNYNTRPLDCWTFADRYTTCDASGATCSWKDLNKFRNSAFRLRGNYACSTRTHQSSLVCHGGGHHDHKYYNSFTGNEELDTYYAEFEGRVMPFVGCKSVKFAIVGNEYTCAITSVWINNKKVNVLECWGLAFQQQSCRISPKSFLIDYNDQFPTMSFAQGDFYFIRGSNLYRLSTGAQIKTQVKGVSGSCAIKEDDTLECWGGAATNMPSDLGKVQSFSNKSDITICAVTKFDKTPSSLKRKPLYCWGTWAWGLPKNINPPAEFQTPRLRFTAHQ